MQQVDILRLQDRETSSGQCAHEVRHGRGCLESAGNQEARGKVKTKRLQEHVGGRSRGRSLHILSAWSGEGCFNSSEGPNVPIDEARAQIGHKAGGFEDGGVEDRVVKKRAILRRLRPAGWRGRGGDDARCR